MKKHYIEGETIEGYQYNTILLHLITDLILSKLIGRLRLNRRLTRIVEHNQEYIYLPEHL